MSKLFVLYYVALILTEIPNPVFDRPGLSTNVLVGDLQRHRSE
jgi:hypothetical protein